MKATIQRLQIVSNGQIHRVNFDSKNQSVIPNVIYVTHKYNLCDLKLSSAQIAERKEQAPYYEALALNVQRIKEFNPEYQVRA